MTTKTPLFDVIISVYGDKDTGGGIYDVFIIDKYHGIDPWVMAHQSNMTSLDQAMQFAKGAVTAFMEGTKA